MATTNPAKKTSKKPSEQKNTTTVTITLAHGEQINTRTGHISQHPTDEDPFMVFSTNASGGATSARMRIEIHRDDLIQTTESGEGKPATVVYKSKPALSLSYTGEFTKNDNGTWVSVRFLKGGEAKTTTIYPNGRRLLSLIEKTSSAASSNMKEKTKGDSKKPAKSAKPAAE